MAEVLHRCTTKATTEVSDGVRRSLAWTFARRGVLEVRDDALICGDWVIPYDEVDEAILYSVRQVFIPGYVLFVRSGGTDYQFGLNWGRFWAGELPFPVRRERGRLGSSWTSLAARAAIWGGLAYWLWGRLRG